MTNEELSNEFDVLINSYFTVDNYGKGEGALEFNEYEKSVFFFEFQRLFPVHRKIVVCVFIIGSRYLIGADFSEKLNGYQITVSKYSIFHIQLFLSS